MLWGQGSAGLCSMQLQWPPLCPPPPTGPSAAVSHSRIFISESQLGMTMTKVSARMGNLTRFKYLSWVTCRGIFFP